MIIKTNIKGGSKSWFLRRFRLISPGKKQRSSSVYCADDFSALIGSLNDNEDGEPTEDPDY